MQPTNKVSNPKFIFVMTAFCEAVPINVTSYKLWARVPLWEMAVIQKHYLAYTAIQNLSAFSVQVANSRCILEYVVYGHRTSVTQQRIVLNKLYYEQALSLKRYLDGFGVNCCAERSMHLLTDERLMLVTAQDVNINGVLLG